MALEDEVGKCDALIEKAAIYPRDIADDLADTATGTLRVDADETARHGTLHITLNSLDRWARKKYGISIYDTLTSHESKDDLNYTPTVEVEPDERAGQPQRPCPRIENAGAHARAQFF